MDGSGLRTTSIRTNRMSQYNKDFDLPAKAFDFKKDLAFGHLGEDSVRQFYNSVINGSAEVKTDRYRNGRMVVETQQNPRRQMDEFGEQVWVNSGINVTKANWWIYIYSLGDAFIIVSVDRLKRYLRANKMMFTDERKIIFARSSDNPAKGFLLEPQHVMEMLYSEEYD